MIEVNEGHRLHLTALIRQEQDLAYRRHDYLSREWQLSLWREEIKEIMTMHSLRYSPSSVTMTNTTSSCNIVTPDAPSDICVRWREKIIEWKYQVVDRFDLDREIVGISTFYLDRYLSMNYVEEELFQLVAMSSIYLAIKIHSTKKVTIQSIASTGNGSITTKHIEAMELSIMKSLNWHLFPPTSVAFIENILPLILSTSSEEECKEGCTIKGHASPLSPQKLNETGTNTTQYTESLEFSRFLAELSVCAYPFVSVKPSSIALAAVLYSFELFGLDSSVRESLYSLANDELGLDLDSSEVVSCGALLRRVYQHAK